MVKAWIPGVELVTFTSSSTATIFRLILSMISAERSTVTQLEVPGMVNLRLVPEPFSMTTLLITKI